MEITVCKIKKIHPWVNGKINIAEKSCELEDRKIDTIQNETWESRY